MTVTRTQTPAPLPLCLLALVIALPLSGCLRIQEPLANSDVDGNEPIGGQGGSTAGDAAHSAGAGGTGGMAPDGESAGTGGWPDPVYGGGGAGGSWSDDMGWGFAGMAAVAGMGGGYGGTSGGHFEGAGGSYGIAGTGAGAGGAAGGCDCDDGNACTLDYCTADGECVHESIATMTDADGDGVSSGCDCDDQNPDVSPEQTEFFSEPLGEPGFGRMYSFDYDCDGLATPLLNNIAHGCRLYEGLDACYGEGWLVDDRRTVPDCGSGGAYQICRFVDGECSPQVLMMIQRCR